MIVFAATLILIIAAVVARAGVAASSGSIHSLGGRFALSGHQLSSPSAGRLFLCGIVVRIAGLLGFSMLLGASTCAPGLPRIAAGPEQRALTGSRRETAVRCAWTAIAPATNPSSARAGRHRQARARSRTLLRHEANIMSGRPQRAGWLGERRSPKSEGTALGRPGVRRGAPGKKERR